MSHPARSAGQSRRARDLKADTSLGVQRVVFTKLVDAKCGMCGSVLILFSICIFITALIEDFMRIKDKGIEGACVYSPWVSLECPCSNHKATYRSCPTMGPALDGWGSLRLLVYRT